MDLFHPQYVRSYWKLKIKMKPAGYSSACTGDPSAERTDQAWQKRPSSGALKKVVVDSSEDSFVRNHRIFQCISKSCPKCQLCFIYTHTNIYQDVINIRVYTFHLNFFNTVIPVVYVYLCSLLLADFSGKCM